MFGGASFSGFLTIPADGIIHYNLSRNCNKYFRTNLTENLGKVKDKNNNEFDVHYFEDDRLIVIMAIDPVLDKAVAGLTLKRIQQKCVNKAFEIHFGGVDKDFRGVGLAEKLTEFLSEDHIKWMQQDNRSDKLYLSLGNTISYAMIYLGQKQFDLGKHDVWFCRTVDEVSDETKVDMLDEEKLKDIKKNIRIGYKLFVCNK